MGVFIWPLMPVRTFVTVGLFDQAGKSHNLAAGTGKPLTALVVVILAAGTHIEGIFRRVVGGTLVVQIGGRQLEAALGVQRGSLRAVGSVVQTMLLPPFSAHLILATSAPLAP